MLSFLDLLHAKCPLHTQKSAIAQINRGCSKLKKQKRGAATANAANSVWHLLYAQHQNLLQLRHTF